MKQIKTTTIDEFLRQNMTAVSTSKYDMSNIFNIVNKGQNSYFNIAKTINFYNVDELSSDYYQVYKVIDGDTWPLISYKFYNNIKLWWLICKFNNIKNPFVDLKINMILKIPTLNFMSQIVESINK